MIRPPLKLTTPVAGLVYVSIGCGDKRDEMSDGPGWDVRHIDQAALVECDAHRGKSRQRVSGRSVRRKIGLAS
jgi:hypothetical protein